MEIFLDTASVDEIKAILPWSYNQPILTIGKGVDFISHTDAHHPNVSKRGGSILPITTCNTILKYMMTLLQAKISGSWIKSDFSNASFSSTS